MSTPFRACPACGCNLDPGERCDCTSTPAADRAAAETAKITPPERAYCEADFTRDASGKIRITSVSLVGRPPQP